MLNNFSNVFEKLKEEIFAGEVLKNEPMSLHTSFKTGGEADIFVIPGNGHELKKAIVILKEENVPFYVIGNRSM